MPETGRAQGPLAGAAGGLADRLPDRGRAAGRGCGSGGAEEWGVWVEGGRWVGTHPTLALGWLSIPLDSKQYCNTRQDRPF